MAKGPQIGFIIQLDPYANAFGPEVWMLQSQSHILGKLYTCGMLKFKHEASHKGSNTMFKNNLNQKFKLAVDGSRIDFISSKK